MTTSGLIEFALPGVMTSTQNCTCTSSGAVIGSPFVNARSVRLPVAVGVPPPAGGARST